MGLRVCQITTVAQSIAILMRGWPTFLHEKGFTVDALATREPGFDAAIRREHIAEFHAVHIPRQISPLRDLVALWKLYRILRREKYDLVHASTPKGGLLGMIAAFAAGTPARIFTLRGLIGAASTGFKRRVLMCTDWLSMKLAHRVVAIAPTLREEAISLGLVSPEKIQSIHKGSSNGINWQRFTRKGPSSASPLRAKWKVGPSDIVLGFVGRIVRDKGIIELAQAWRRIREECPNVKLVLVGPAETHNPVPTEIIDELIADPRVCMAGWFDDTAQAFEAFDVLVMPSYREGFGNVLLEAGSMELPAISTRISGISDAIVDGETGLLVEVRNADALAEGVIKLLKDPELRRRMGRAARERVVRDFRPEIVWNGLLGVYRDVLQRAGYDVGWINPAPLAELLAAAPSAAADAPRPETATELASTTR